MSYTPGNIVYAKLKGYPWWPARVEIESTLPSNVLSKKPKGPKPICGVRFFGTGDYGWFGNNDLKPFEKKEAEILLQKMQNKRRDDLLKKSIREALNPSSFDDPMEEDVEETATDDDEVELEDESKKSTESLENDDGEYDKKSKVRSKGTKKDKGHTVSKTAERQTKASRSTKPKRKTRDYSSEEEVGSRSGKGVKKRRATEDKLSKRKRSSVSLSYTDDEAEQMDVDEPRAEVDVKKKQERRQSSKKDRGTSRSEGSKSPGKFDGGSPITDVVENKQINDDAGFDRKVNKLESESQHRSTKSRQFKTPSEKLLHFRHKLQRMTIKSTKIELHDMGKIDEVFTEVENFPITIPLLKESKIGKLMRKIADLKIEPDPYNIKDRSDELIKKWKFLLEAPTQEGTDEDASPNMTTQVEGNSPQHETVKNEEINQLLPDEREVDVKNEELDRVENNRIKPESTPSAMELEKAETHPMANDDKHMSEDVITNGSSPAANNQGVSIQEKEIVHNKSPEL